MILFFSFPFDLPLKYSHSILTPSSSFSLSCSLFYSRYSSETPRQFSIKLWTSSARRHHHHHLSPNTSGPPPTHPPRSLYKLFHPYNSLPLPPSSSLPPVVSPNWVLRFSKFLYCLKYFFSIDIIMCFASSVCFLFSIFFCSFSVSFLLLFQYSIT